LSALVTALSTPAIRGILIFLTGEGGLPPRVKVIPATYLVFAADFAENPECS